MSAVIAATGEASGEVLARLVSWSGAGLLAPFIWWAGDNGRLVRAGVAEDLRLADALAHEGLGAEPLVVVAAFPDASNAIDVTVADTMRRVAADTRRALPGAQVSPVVICLRADESTRVAPPRAAAGAVVVVEPDDQEAPDAPNRLTAEGFASHAAHALACLTGLLVGRGGDAVLDPARLGWVDPGSAVLVRCHSRVVDAGHLGDELVARAVTPDGGWLNPDPAELERMSAPEGLTGLLARRLVDLHQAVLGVTPPLVFPIPEPRRLGLLDAIREIWRHLVAQLTLSPMRWADRLAERVWDGTLVPAIDRAGAGAGVRLVPYRESAAPGEPISAALRRSAPHEIATADGAVGPAWRDLVRLTTGVVDGGDLPVQAPEIEQRGRRILLSDPADVVPDPTLPPPMDEPPRPCDPRAVNAAVEARRAALPPPEPVVAADPAAQGAEAPTPAPDPPAPAAEAEVDPLEVWRDARAAALMWQVGQALSEEMDEASRTSEGPAEERWDELDGVVEEAATEQRRRGRHRGWWLLGGLALVVASVLVPVIGVVSLTLLPVLLVGALVVWVGARAVAAWRGLGRARRDEQRIAAIARGLMDAAVLAALRRGDQRRLKRRYEEYLDWAQLLGELVHRPWLEAGTPAAPRPALAAVPADLPAACLVGVSRPDDHELRVLAAAGAGAVFSRGWLGALARRVMDGARDEWIELYPAAAEPLPDPLADTSRDPASLRGHVLEAVVQGRGRAVADSGLAEDVLRQVAKRPVDAVLGLVAAEGQSALAMRDWLGASFLDADRPAWIGDANHLGEDARRVVVTVIAPDAIRSPASPLHEVFDGVLAPARPALATVVRVDCSRPFAPGAADGPGDALPWLVAGDGPPASGSSATAAQPAETGEDLLRSL